MTRNTQAIIDYCKEKSSKLEEQVAEILFSEYANMEGVKLLIGVGFEAGRKFQADNPGLALDDPTVYVLAPLDTGPTFYDIVFDAGPGPVAGRFVEVEDSKGRGVQFGEWVERPDGYWVLRVPVPKEQR